MSDKTYTLPEGFPEPTVYASLMNVALESPVADWTHSITEKIGKVLDMFEQAGVDNLKKAYAAGVADGYRQALVEIEKGKHRD